MIGDATTVIVAALADAIRAQTGTIGRLLTIAVDGRVEALRRTRVASRRLREALAVVTTVGLRIDIVRVERDARRLTRALGPVREMDVALQQFDLAARLHRWPADQHAAIRRALEAQRDRRRRAMTKSLRRFDRASFTARCRQVANAVDATTDTRAWWEALSDRVRLRAQDVIDAVDACGTLYAPERLHTLRIAIKKLRYALEFAGGIPGVHVSAMADALKHAQDRFGHLHDVQMLLAEIEQLAGVTRRASVRRSLAAVVDDLERDCRVIHAELLPLLPGLRRTAGVVAREVRVRARSRRLPMAKATAAEVTPARDAARPARTGRAKPH